MKHTLFFFAALILAASCSGKLSPVQQAIVSAIEENNAEVKDIRFTELTLIDSTTVGQELDLRQKLFETKIKVEEKYVAKYNSQGLWTNEQKHRKALYNAENILTGIAGLREELTDCKDSVVYRTYVFSCIGHDVNGKKFVCDKKFINITSGGEAYNMSSTDDRHNSMGFTIPGYSALLDSVSEGSL